MPIGDWNCRKLMVSFVRKQDAKLFISFLHDNEVTDKVFVLKTEQKNVYLITYNVKKELDMSNLSQYGVLKTITVQRNKATNTLYSLNAMNEILLELKELDEYRDKELKDVKINWDKYINNLITVSEGKVVITKTILKKFIPFNEDFDIEKLDIERYVVKKEDNKNDE